MKKLPTGAWKAAIPVGMRVLPRWVGHEKKRPLAFRGGPGRVDDPKTWGTFEEAVRFYQEHEADPNVGVGFVFNGDGAVFVDVDKVLTDVYQAPDGRVSSFTWVGPPEVKTLLEGVSTETYAEVSPSGTGLHVFGLGKLPEGARQKREPIELYETGRYSTVTGYKLGSADALRGFQPRLARLAAYVGERETSTEESKPEPERAAEAAAALSHLNPDMPYEAWLRVGMALKAGLGAKGRDLWLAWSSEGTKFQKGEPEEKWSSFRKGGVGLGTLFHMAYGEGEVRPSAEEEFKAFAAPEEKQSAEEKLGLRLVPLSSVQKEKVDWLWRGRLARGHLALVAGDGGKGKSIMTLDLASRISAGRSLPGEPEGARPPGRVLLLNAEDGQADTIRPRAEAAGADLERILVLDLLHGGRPPQLPDDIPMLAAVIEAAGDVDLVVLDPLNACIPVRLDAHKDQHVRQALQPLAAMAQRLHVAIALVVHLNKASDAAATLYRVSGSIGIGAAARSVLFVGPHPDEENDRVVAQAKPQLGPPPASLAFRIRGLESDPDIGVVEWLGETDAEAGDLTPRRQGQEEGHGKGEAAAAWLEKRLAGGEAGATEVFRDAKSAGFGRNSVKSAAKRLGVQKQKQGKTGGWVWKLDTFKPVTEGTT